MPTAPAQGTTSSPAGRTERLGRAWLGLCLALALHVTDEALTGFLSVYNPTVSEMRRRVPWWPMPTFQFGPWLGGLIFFVVFLFALSPLFSRRGTPIRPLAWIFAALMVMNGVGHTLGTLFGQTFGDIRFPRPMPGFYSSPLLIAAAVWVMYELHRSRRQD